jgi:cardiolipin synthase
MTAMHEAGIWAADLRPALALALHVGLAGAVTAHVLLRKEDVGSATGWIGLAWLSPVVGAGLYLLFGINRVRRRAQELRRAAAGAETGDMCGAPVAPEHLRPLDRAAAAETGRSTVGGNRIETLRNGDEAYPLMLEAIGAARTSIGLASYIFRDDEAGRPFLDALSAASGRGVDVRVLIDGIGGGYFTSAAWRRLRRSKVPAARFMHSLLPWRMPFLNLRLHKKLLVVDGARAFVGGLNIGGENLMAAKPRHPVLDHHFLIEGPAVAQLSRAFAGDWRMATDEELPPSWFPSPAPAGGRDMRQVMRIVTAGPDQDNEKIEFVALMAITCAKDSVSLMTPYFLPGEKLLSALTLAAHRGVRVDIVMPSRSNHRGVDFAARANIAPLLKAGCRIWLNPPPFDHSKLMVVDEAWALIGSSNWDVRSFRLNFELGVEVYDAGFAGAVEAIMAAKRGQQMTLEDLARRSPPARIRDAAFRLALPYL